MGILVNLRELRSLRLGSLTVMGLALGVAQGQTGLGSYPPTAQVVQAPGLVAVSPAQLQGSAADGEATSETLSLTLEDAVGRGLRFNLGVLLRDAGTESARGGVWRATSGLLPQITGSVSETAAQTNLNALGISIPGLNPIVGPYGYSDARVQGSATVFDWTAIKNLQTARAGAQAAKLSYKDARDQVAQAVAAGYFQVIATSARVDSLRAQADSAKAVFDRAQTQRKAGVSAGIDVLRAQVEYKRDQQLLVVQTNQFAKDKLTLARIIGLPMAQRFELADKANFKTVSHLTPEEALLQAYTHRSDYQAQLALVRAAGSAKSAARAEYYPTLVAQGNYGDVGKTFGHSHGTFDVIGGVKFNIFDGGRIHGDMLQADATLRQRNAELADLKSHIEYDVRTALLDLGATGEQVEVAQVNLELARQTIEQARDRFGAGVSDSVEVVQAQQQLASAEESYISGVFAHNLAKVATARSLGQAEDNWKYWMEGFGAEVKPEVKSEVKPEVKSDAKSEVVVDPTQAQPQEKR